MKFLGDGVLGEFASPSAGLAAAREIVMSGTVVDLVLGSAASFSSRGMLKGVPGRRELFSVAG